ncbi:hypothetical protein MKW98_006181 [Papaver atlanticum]|uniref:Glutamate receptor n=1 Tax=Papaver atlanticum TaxID=357466 RepID=A0AAD4XU76_9MAGN|nr:hypothetical protein MKW98_006181 [Papaver atlanticum]
MKTEIICHPKQIHVLFFFIFMSIMLTHHHEMVLVMGEKTKDTIDNNEFKVGVVLDFDSLVSKIGLTSMSMALFDFYSTTDDSHKRKLVLHTRDSHGDIADAASQARDLIKNVGVQAIIGPLTSLQAIIVADLGNKAQVPIISFTATSPTVSTSQNPYFIRTTHSDLAQVNVIAELVKTFGWKQVVPIYEDTEYGRGVIPYLTDAFQAIDTKVPFRSIISPSATDAEILKELYKLMAMQTRVFVVHMTESLGIRVFQKAKMIGMMNEGYAWIITDGLANFLGSFNSSVIDSMQGVLGVRPYIPRSIELDEFRARWKKRFAQDNPDTEKLELNIFGLRAYDTVWALANVLERLETMNSSHLWKSQAVYNRTAMAASGVSQIGPMLLQLMHEINFAGLSGDFNLIDRELQSDTFQLLNVIGNGGREIGVWTTSNGISRDSSSLITTRAKDYSTPKDNLRAIIWPGESTVVPKGWVFPEDGKKLRIGVPVKRGFTEFVKVTRNSSVSNSSYVITGYCIDVFKAVLELLPYPVLYEFVPFEKADGTTAGTYDDLAYQVYDKNYDAIVGDLTISANRSSYVDFTLPYTPSGFSMIVPLKDQTGSNWLILFKPLNGNLWIAIIVFFLLTGFVTWVLECQDNNPAFRWDFWNQPKTIADFLFSITTFSANNVHSSMAKVVLYVWVFVFVMISSSYLAGLTSMLTAHRLEPTVTDVYELIKNRQNVGYVEGAFVYTMLKKMGFNDANLKPYYSSEDFKEAFTELRKKEERIVAAFDEAPYNRLILAKYCHKYALVGPVYKTGGFAFAFPKGSPLVPDISEAILILRENEGITKLEQTWFGNHKGCSDPDATAYKSSLNLESYYVLFGITGFFFIVAFIVIVGKLLWRNTSLPVMVDNMWQCLRNFWQYIKDLWHRLRQGQYQPIESLDT